MEEKFDAYFKWLGIPPGEQPPNRYRLLGVPLFVDDPAVVEHAADQRMAHLRTFQTGKHAADCLRLLNEVATARVTLLSPAKKAAYDERLREKLHAANALPRPSGEDASGAVWAGALDLDTSTISVRRSEHAGRRSLSNPTILGIAGAVSVALVGVVLWWALGSGGGGEGSLAEAGPQTPARHPSVQPPKPPAPLDPAFAQQPGTVVPEQPKADEPPPVPLAGLPEPDPEPTVVDGEETAPTSEEFLRDEPGPDGMVPEPAPVRLPPPSAAEQKRLAGTIDEVYEIGGVTDPTARMALAQRLLADGRRYEGNPSEQFVLLRRASELARDAGNALLMLEAVDAIVEAGFQLPVWRTKTLMLKAMLSQADRIDASGLPAMAEASISAAEQAAADGAVEEALEVLVAVRGALTEARSRGQTAYRAARLTLSRARTPDEKAEREQAVREAERTMTVLDTALAAAARSAKGLEMAHREQEAVRLAQEWLQTNPDDPDACLTVGRWLCFDRDDWEAGLELLAKGSDEPLKALAAADLALRPSNSRDRVAQGDAWWDAAEKAEEPVRGALRRRAGHWYEGAWQELSGLAQKRVETRLLQIAEDGTPTATPAGPPAAKPVAGDSKPSHEERIRPRAELLIGYLVDENYEACVEMTDPAIVRQRGVAGTKIAYQLMGAFVKLGSITRDRVRIDAITVADDAATATAGLSLRTGDIWKPLQPLKWRRVQEQWYLEL